MPQLDISTYSSQLFWLFVNFVLFLSICTFFILPRFSKNLNHRKSIIEQNYKISEMNKYKASEILSSVNKRFDSLNTELNDKFRNKRNELFKTFIEQKDKIKSDTKNKLRSSIAEIESNAKDLSNEISVQFIDDLVKQLELKCKK